MYFDLRAKFQLQDFSLKIACFEHLKSFSKADIVKINHMTAKKLHLQNCTTALQFWVRGTEKDTNISTQPDNGIQVRNQRIIEPISIKLRDGTSL